MIAKLQEMIAEAYIVPKERVMNEGISEKEKTIRREDKRHRGEVRSKARKRDIIKCIAIMNIRCK